MRFISYLECRAFQEPASSALIIFPWRCAIMIVGPPFRAEHRRDRATVPFPMTTTALRLPVWLRRDGDHGGSQFGSRASHSRRISAIDFRDFAFASKLAAFHFFRHGLPQLVEQYECGLIGQARSREMAKALLPFTSLQKIAMAAR